jgi:hypothetical protein
MPTLLPPRQPARPPKAEYDFSPLLVLFAAALAIALVSLEAEMLGGPRTRSATPLLSKGQVRRMNAFHRENQAVYAIITHRGRPD